MSQYPPSREFSARARVSGMDAYRAEYERSVADPDGYWAAKAGRLWWDRPWVEVCRANMDVRRGPVEVEWFRGGRTNVSVNCLDRHLDERGGKTAILWEGNDPGEVRRLTYLDLHREVCRFANVLRGLGVGRGDRVATYMSNVPELAVAVLACARIGAVHSVVFGGFSAESLAKRLVDAGAKALVTADGAMRGTKHIPLKETADEAVALAAERGLQVESVVVLRRTGREVAWHGRDRWWHEEMAAAADSCEPEAMASEDPLFILYTSGSTGTPKGILHTTGGYMVYAQSTFETVFDHRDDDVYWCTADIGWITGHTYIVYGPLLAGATTVLFEGMPVHPDPGRLWDTAARHGVTVFYTAPTAIRALLCEPDEYVRGNDLSSLRLLGSVGEPIDPEAWRWYHDLVGEGRCPIVDTWWQTETGGIMISPLPGATPLKPGKASFPLFGVEPVILDPATGEEMEGECEGVLAVRAPWPGLARTVWGDHERYEKTYFSDYPGYYFTGDGCLRDADGYHRITGRVDDVLNVSGHRLGTAEIEGALDEHPQVGESAVVGAPHPVKGEGIHAFVILKTGEEAGPGLAADLKNRVREVIGPVATPESVRVVPGLPKTRSGKIMRRILRKIAAHETDDLGDVSTLADPSVVESILSNSD